MKRRSSINDSVRAWGLYLLAGLLATGGYFLLPSATAQTILYNLIGVASAAAIVAGIRLNRPKRPLPWKLFAAGLSLLVVGDLLWTFHQSVAWSSLPFPPVAGVPYLAGYLAIAAGLLLLSWNRSGGWISFIDPAIIATGVGLLSWIFLMELSAKNLSAPLFELELLISYLLMDLLLLAAAARLLMVSEARLSAYSLLALGTAFSLVAYTICAPDILAGAYTPGGPADAGWLLFYVLFGAAALHPSMAATAQTPREREEKLTWWRFALLGGTSLMVPVALMVEAALGAPVGAPVIAGSAVLFVLVLARMAVLMRVRENALRRERILRKFGEALVGAPDRETIYRASLEAVLNLAKTVPGAGASFAAGSAKQMTVAATAGDHPWAPEGLRIDTEDLPEPIRQSLLDGRPGELSNVRLALLWKVLGDVFTEGNVEYRREVIDSLFVMPLYVRGELGAAIYVSAGAPLPASVRESLEVLGVNVSLALERAVLGEELHRRHSEARFEALVRNASGVIMILDEDGTIRYASPSCKPILSYEPEDLFRSEALALVHPEDKLQARTHFAGIPDEPGARMALEFRMRHADGSWRHMESVATNLLDDSDVRGVVINCRDITKRKNSEEALKKAELRYRTLVEQIPAVTYINPLDETDDSIYISPRIQNMLGYSVEEGRKDPELWDRILHPEDRERVIAEEARTSATGEPFKIEYRMISRDGRVVWVRDEAMLVRDDEGRPQFWQGIMLDITELKQAEMQLRYRFDFERIISDTSTKFVDLAPEEVDSGIEEALREIGEFSGADRSYLFLCSEDGTTIENTHEWCAEGIEPQIENLKDIPVETWPWAMKKFRKGEVNHVPRVADLPEEAAAEKAECEAEDLRSFVQIPMLREGSLVGFIGFDSVRAERVWSENEISLLKTVGELFTNALERRRAQRALQEAEERYRSLIEHIPAVTYIQPADDTEVINYISPQIERLVGYTPEEYSRPGFWIELLHPDDRERVAAEDERTNETLEPFSIEYRLRSREGRYVWVREEGVIVRDEEGEPQYWQGFMWDISDRKEAEEALKKSEASLAEAQRIARIGNWEWDVASGEIRWSDEVFRIYGYSPGEFVPTIERLMEIVHPEDREMLRERIHGVLNEQRPYDFTHRILRPDGTERVIHRQAEVVFGEDGQPLRMVGTIHDITERKRAEEALRESETKHRALVENIPAVTYTHPADGSEAPTEDMTYISPQAEELFGYTAEERLAGVGGTWIDMLHPDDRERVLAEDVRTNRTGEPFSMEYRRRTREGRYIWVRDEATLVRDEKGNPQYWQGFLWDITDRKRIEEKLKSSEAELRALFEAMSEVILVLDGEGRHHRVISNDPSLLYAQADERVGKMLHEVLPEEKADLFLDTVRQVLKTRRTVHVEYSLDIEGERKWFSATVSPMLEDRVVWVARDITDRRRAEEAIREAENRYRTLVEQVPAAIYLLDAEHNGRIRYISPQIESIVGYTPEEYISRPDFWSRMVHPEDRERVIAEDKRTDETGEPFSSEYRAICRNGDVVWIRDEAVLVRDVRERPKFWQGVMLDITAQKKLEEELTHQAFHDELTGLPNRALFMDRLKHALARTERRERSLAVLYMDVDNFKFVNDSLGHEAGDTLLVQTARRIEKCLRPEDTAARLGGDEFTVLLEDLADAAAAAQVARRILQELRAPFFLEGHEVSATVSIGVTLSRPGHEKPSDLLRDADTALYRAKAGGKAGYVVFERFTDHQTGRSSNPGL